MIRAIFYLLKLAKYKSWVSILKNKFVLFCALRLWGGSMPANSIGKITGSARQQIIDNTVNILLKKQLNQGNKERYLLYVNNSVNGIDNHKSNLKYYLLEAKKLDRICVIVNTEFSKFHNKNIEMKSEWTKYIDFNKSSFNGNIDYIFNQEFMLKSFLDTEVLVINRAHNIRDEDNTKYRLIIRNIDYFGQSYRKLYLAENIPLQFYPSAKVFNEAKISLNQLPKLFCSIAIRRTDRITSVKVGELTSPPNVLLKLKQYNSNKLPVFLMTDEPDKDFYNSLKNEFDIYRYYDFDNLVKVANDGGGDNFLLYEIEKLIFLTAKIKIHTFKNAWIENSITDIKVNNNKWQEFTPESCLVDILNQKDN